MDLTLNESDMANLSALQKDAIVQALLLSLGMDRVVEREELAQFNDEVRQIPWGIEDRVISDMVQAARVHVKLISNSDEALAWIREIAARLPEGPVREKTLATMARIAMANGVNYIEKGVLNAFAAALAVPAERLEQLREELLRTQQQAQS